MDESGMEMDQGMDEREIELLMQEVLEEERNDRKCVLLGNIDGLQEVCIGNDYIDIKRYNQRMMKKSTYDGGDVISAVDVDMGIDFGHDEITNSTEVEVDYIDYENWKYKKSVFVDEMKMLDNYQGMSVGYKYNLIPNVEQEFVYKSRRYEIMPLPIEIGEEQCWSLGMDLLLCLFVDGEDIIGFQIEIDGKVYDTEFYRYYDDNNWDEVNVYTNEEMIEKCVHLLEIKICIEVDESIKDKLDIIQINVLTLSDDYEDDDNDEEVFF